jgi:hypothetical protein
VTEFRAPRVELLGAQHDRSSFSCGISALDDYFQNQAGQDARRSVTRVSVAVDDLTGAIVGFYTLSATSIAWSDIPEHLARKLTRYPIPATLIGRLAVDRRFHQRSFGKYLLFNALDRVAILARQIAVHRARRRSKTVWWECAGLTPLEVGRRGPCGARVPERRSP